MQPLQNCIGPTIRIGQEILCLPYAGFFFKKGSPQPPLPGSDCHNCSKTVVTSRAELALVL